MKQAGQAFANGFLWILELVLKLTSSVAAAISLGSTGSFFEKVGNGFASLPRAVGELYRTVSGSGYIVDVINDYNSMTAAAFNQKYGGGAVNYVMAYLNEGVNYLLNVYENLSLEPASTLFAALLVFAVLYLSARGSRFVRQRGQGSFIDKMERRAGKKMFRSETAENVRKL